MGIYLNKPWIKLIISEMEIYRVMFIAINWKYEMVSEKSVGEFPNLFITFYFYDISEMLKKYKITRESRRIYKFFGITCYILKSRRNLSQGSVKTWNYFKKKNGKMDSPL